MIMETSRSTQKLSSVTTDKSTGDAKPGNTLDFRLISTDFNPGLGRIPPLSAGENRPRPSSKIGSLVCREVASWPAERPPTERNGAATCRRSKRRSNLSGRGHKEAAQVGISPGCPDRAPWSCCSRRRAGDALSTRAASSESSVSSGGARANDRLKEANDLLEAREQDGTCCQCGNFPISWSSATGRHSIAGSQKRRVGGFASDSPGVEGGYYIPALRPDQPFLPGASFKANRPRPALMREPRPSISTSSRLLPRRNYTTTSIRRWTRRSAREERAVGRRRRSTLYDRDPDCTRTREWERSLPRPGP